MSAPQTVLTLIENFERNFDAYRDVQYNETQVRRDFIDPMFTALGWDMDNNQGYAEAYRDVIHEDAIKVGLSTRAPDYSFRVGGQRKFFSKRKSRQSTSRTAWNPHSSYVAMRGWQNCRCPSSPTSRNSQFMTAARNPIKTIRPATNRSVNLLKFANGIVRVVKANKQYVVDNKGPVFGALVHSCRQAEGRGGTYGAASGRGHILQTVSPRSFPRRAMESSSHAVAGSKWRFNRSTEFLYSTSLASNEALLAAGLRYRLSRVRFPRVCRMALRALTASPNSAKSSLAR